MALEELITKLTVALDANTAAVTKSGAASPSNEKPAGGKKGGPTVDFDTVKVAATKVMESKGRPLAKKLISDVGGAKELSGVKPDKFPALLKAFESALAEADAKEVEDDDEL